MPGKSRHRRGKHVLSSKKKRGRRSLPATAAQQKAVTQISKPAVTSPEVAAPPESVSPLIPTSVRHADLATELRRIGILAGIMLAALLLLALILD